MPNSRERAQRTQRKGMGNKAQNGEDRTFDTEQPTLNGKTEGQGLSIRVFYQLNGQ
ncbi:MAG: hypothetical protein JWQ71_1323 [Pedosphaera sp.]|nr:hypothetical protein [Pedosphaera sp.]